MFSPVKLSLSGHSCSFLLSTDVQTISSLVEVQVSISINASSLAKVEVVSWAIVLLSLGLLTQAFVEVPGSIHNVGLVRGSISQAQSPQENKAHWSSYSHCSRGLV